MRIEFRGQNFYISEILKDQVKEKTLEFQRDSKEEIVDVFITIIKFQRSFRVEVTMINKNKKRYKKELVKDELYVTFLSVLDGIKKQMDK